MLALRWWNLLWDSPSSHSGPVTVKEYLPSLPLSISFLTYHLPSFSTQPMAPLSSFSSPFLFGLTLSFTCPLPPYLNGSTGSCTCLIAAVLAIKCIIQDFGTGVHRIHEDRHMLMDLAQVSKSVVKQGLIDESGVLKDICPGVLLRYPGYPNWYPPVISICL